MKKILLLSALLLCLITSAQTLNDVYTMTFNELSYSVPESKASAGEVIGTVLETLAGNATSKKHPELAPGISAMVKAAFTGVRRLAVVNDDAQFEVTGNINSISTTTSTRTVERTDNKGKSYKTQVNDYQASIGITLTLTEVATGQEWTHSFSAENTWLDSPRTESEAVEIAINRLQQDVAKCYNNMFPLVANIVEKGKSKKEKQQEVYIDLGDNNGVHKDLHFTVFRLGEVAGKETRQKLGKLKIEEVMGDDISRCKVEKGHKEIKNALDSGELLLVVSTD